jgi:hypothetical protein
MNVADQIGACRPGDLSGSIGHSVAGGDNLGKVQRHFQSCHHRHQKDELDGVLQDKGFHLMLFERELEHRSVHSILLLESILQRQHQDCGRKLVFVLFASMAFVVP